MGWASAGEIFDPVAQALLDLGADRDTKRRVLGTLIDKLRDGAWDTEDESLHEFRHDVDIVALFHERGIGTEMYGDQAEGILGYDERRNLWTLTCHGREGCGELDAGDGSLAEEHDRLVHLWAQHDADRHGGDGKVDRHLLINAR
jgi:hypothetical protein